nr:unnamed protein product [Callosobruchus analis]CAI5851342.1 unnamed protein product [Callosobruchus analis]
MSLSSHHTNSTLIIQSICTLTENITIPLMYN